jgi:dihydroorotase
MLAGLLDGSLDCVATDHAPHAMHEKKQEFERAPMGITGLETALGLCLSELHAKHGMSLSKVIALLSTTPAAVIGGPLKSKGSLKTGSVADVTIFDPSAKWDFDVRRSRSKSRNTPFDGRQMLGRVEYTIVHGDVVYQAGK